MARRGAKSYAPRPTSSQAKRRDPSKRDRRKAFYRDMLGHRRQAQEIVQAWRL
jgi:hypothetical protein